MQGLQEVILKGNLPEWIACLLPNVKSLTYHCFCNDAFLRSVAEHCSRLERLDVSFTYRVTDDGLAHFLSGEQRKEIKSERTISSGSDKVPCPLLTEIHMLNARANVGGIVKLLKNLPLLKKVEHYQLPWALRRLYMKEFHISGKLKTYNLTYLDLTVCGKHDTTYREVLKAAVSLCPNLKSVVCSVHENEDLNMCSMFPDGVDLNLHFDSLYNWQYNTSEINDFLKKHGGKITGISLITNTNVSVSVLGQFCPRLNTLTVTVRRLKYEENGSTPAFNSLKEFRVFRSSEYEDPAAVCQILYSSPALEELILDIYPSQKLKTAILKCCAQAPLMYMDLNGEYVDKVLIHNILLTCHTLRKFRLNGCHIFPRIYELFT